MTRARKRAIWLALGLVLGGVAVFGIAGWFLSRPVPQRIGDAPLDLNAESVEIPVPGGRVIHGWFSPGRPGAGAVPLLHPLRGNRTTMLGRARFIHADGRAVLLVDLQGHGESAGNVITFGARESDDARAAVAYLHSREPNERVAAVGWSLGGAAALLGQAPLAVDALVLEAVYPTIGEAVADRLRIRLGALGPRSQPASRRSCGSGPDLVPTPSARSTASAASTHLYSSSPASATLARCSPSRAASSRRPERRRSCGSYRARSTTTSTRRTRQSTRCTFGTS